MSSPTSTCSRPEWLFDDSPIPDPHGRGEAALRFLDLMRHPKSRSPGRAFELVRWQRRLVKRTFGDTLPDGRRRISTVPILLPRGSRKTSLAAALALVCLVGPERVPRGEVICAAANGDQARIAYEEITGIIRAHKRLDAACKITDHRARVDHRKSRSKLVAVSSEAGGKHGSTPTVVILDELHAHKSRELHDVLTTALVKSPNTLKIIISTAGRGDDNVAHEVYEDARRIQRGDVVDDSILPVIFEAGPDADWLDEDVWHYVNPGMEYGFPQLDKMREQARVAQRTPAARIAFEQLHLNRWQDKNVHNGFVEMSIYDQGAAPIDPDALKGRPCYLGVDMSVSQDLTAIVAAWRDDDEGFTVLPWFFCPEEGIRRRADRDRVAYPEWEKAGHLIATPGNIVDHRRVADEIKALCERFDVREINFDPNRASLIMSELNEEGYPVAGFDQSWRMMVPAVDTLKRAILAGKFRHGAHPILRWCFSNVAIVKDRNDNETFHKAKSTDRIDGAVASAMACARAAAAPDTRSVYDTESRPDGLIVLD